MSEIFTAQVIAVANLVLAIFAIVTASFAFLAFRKQSQEVAILLEQNKREESERRRAQASRVFVAADPHPGSVVSPYAHNASDFPIYEAQIWQAEPREVSGPDDLGTIFPGKSAASKHEFAFRDALIRTVLTFRDSQGVRWIRMPDGTLSEQTTPSLREGIQALTGPDGQHLSFPGH